MTDIGNYPLININAAEGAENDFRPKNFYWRMKLPADAEWKPREPDDDDKEGKRKKKRMGLDL